MFVRKAKKRRSKLCVEFGPVLLGGKRGRERTRERVWRCLRVPDPVRWHRQLGRADADVQKRDRGCHLPLHEEQIVLMLAPTCS